MPSQDAQPDTTQYAYPAYWAANFTRRAVTVRICSGAPADAWCRSCAWSEKPCLDPLPQTQQCLYFTVRQACRKCVKRPLTPQRSAPKLLWLVLHLVRMQHVTQARLRHRALSNAVRTRCAAMPRI